MSCLIARVLIASQAQHLDRFFDYMIPDELAVDIQLGTRVTVNFQNQLNMGYIWELTDRSEFNDLKSIRELTDDQPLIGPLQYQLINWLAEYYICSRVEVIKLFLPPGANLHKERYYELSDQFADLPAMLALSFSDADLTSTLSLISSGVKANWSEKQWQEKFQQIPHAWNFLIAKKILVLKYGIRKARVHQKVTKIYKWVAQSLPETTPAGNRVRDVLSANPQGLTRAEICAAANVSSSVIDRLNKQDKIVLQNINNLRLPAGFSGETVLKTVNLNEEQCKVFGQLENDATHKLFLLHGVTGSGKTEMYFEAVDKYLKDGMQALYLVPEIALTPQTLQRARNRFGDEVALLHSNMSDGERYDQWYKIKNGEARLVLGARSAIFAPFTNLGLIIVDEEHETTYKQEETPRYHIRQVAEKLSEIAGAKVIFGSATPSIESFYYAETGKYSYLHLEKRFNLNPLPEVSIVDMREELKQGNKNVLSKPLFEAIKESLNNHEQIVLLLNRRGYATFILCRDCGKPVRCPSCDVSMTYHLNEKNIRCHYCDFREKVPDLCPSCHSSRIRYFGHGTQKLEEELGQYFPTARMVRMDMDTTARKGAHQEIYQKLSSGEADILLGTQMVAKGLDLPNVSLVGVISADSTLNLPDFRASERTFHLLTQVAGRTGRGTKLGRVIFQAYHPEHYSIQFAKNHDFIGFYKVEIENRRIMNYPPFSEFIKFNFTGANLIKVSEVAADMGEFLKNEGRKLGNFKDGNSFFEVLGPAPSIIPKIQNLYRWHLLIKSNQPGWLEQVTRSSREAFPFKKYPEIKITRDRNPYSVI